MVKGIPIFMITAGMIKMPRRLNSHARAPTPAHTARHFAAYRFASASFSRNACHWVSLFALFLFFAFRLIISHFISTYINEF